MTTPNIYDFNSAVAENLGGKANGLIRIHQAEKRIPRGFIISPALKGTYPKELEKAYEDFKDTSLAVRSSAINEDGAEHSAAGQYESILWVKDLDHLRSAYDICANSVATERVQAYHNNRGNENPDNTMALVVQEMIDAKFAGVTFTICPLTGNKSILRTDAVEGVGEKLVDGSTTPFTYTYHRAYKEFLEDTYRTSPFPTILLKQIAEEALELEEFFGYPLDLEWAVDKKGVLYWLQARPITSHAEPTLTEFDAIPLSDDEVFTNANIGEMMPGAVCPLTVDRFSEVIDYGLRVMYSKSGAAKMSEPRRYVVSFSNQLYFDFTTMYSIAGSVLGSTKEALERSIVGRRLDEVPEPKLLPWFTRAKNFFGYFRYIAGHAKDHKKLKKIEEEFTFEPYEKNSLDLFTRIDGLQQFFCEMHRFHLSVSGYSGVMNTILTQILTKGGLSQEEADKQLAILLTDIPDIASADVLVMLEELANEIKKSKDLLDVARDKTADELLQWLTSEAPQKIQDMFDAFLQKHGHRAIREADFRTQGWAEEPEKVAANLMGLLHVQAKSKTPSQLNDLVDTLCKAHPKLSRKSVLWAAKKARTGVWKRESSKSMMISVHNRFKKAYRHIGKLAAQEGLLQDEDLIFFLTHAEIGELVQTPVNHLEERAIKRRDLLPLQEEITLPNLSFGTPQPLNQTSAEENDGKLQGIAVSAGIVEATIRIITSVEDTKDLKEGEIICAAYTDIGWTPYYAIASGMITQIGSALSHGAVVAREYGLPMVTGVAGVLETLKTGDKVRLDGAAGTIEIL